MNDTPSWPDSSTGDEAPPPPPPPAPPATPGANASDWPDGAATGWDDPDPGSGRPAWLVAAIVVAVLVGVALVGVAGVLVARQTSGSEVAQDEVEVAPPDEAPAPDGRPGPVVPTGPPTVDPEVIESPADEVTAELLTAIDESELTMIGFQIAAGDGVDGQGQLLDGGESLVVDAADEGAAELTRLRDRLAGLEEVAPDAATDGHRAIRDSYTLHLQAWLDWMTAVGDDPSLLEATNEASGPFSDDIESTAVDFVDELEIGLPPDTAPELEEYAAFIVERGFSGSSGDGGELV